MKLILLLMILLLPTSALAESVFQARIDHANGEISNIDVFVVYGIHDVSNTRGTYEARLESIDGAVLHSQFFSINNQFGNSPPPLEWFDESGIQVVFPKEPRPNFDSGQHRLILPYIPKAWSLSIYRDDVALASSSLAHYADLCGDDICQDSESFESCSQDCASGSRDDYCDAVLDNICDPDCSADKDSDCVLNSLSSANLEANFESFLPSESTNLEITNQDKVKLTLLTAFTSLILVFALSALILKFRKIRDEHKLVQQEIDRDFENQLLRKYPPN